MSNPGVAKSRPTSCGMQCYFLVPGPEQSKTSAIIRGNGIAIAVGGDNRAPITITGTKAATDPKSKYPSNSIGADANMCGYIDYLFGLCVDYWSGVDAMNPGRLGKKIKNRFRLKAKTRNHISVDRFRELADFIVNDIIVPSPVGKRHIGNGTKLCRSFEEWRHAPML